MQASSGYAQAGIARESPHRLDEINKRIRVHSDFLSDLQMALQNLADRLLGGHPNTNGSGKDPRVSPVMCSVDTIQASLEEQHKHIEAIRALINRLQEL